MTEIHYHRQHIRELLMTGFSFAELERLCRGEDELQSVLSQIPSNAGVAIFVDILLDYVERRLIYEPLLHAAERANPRRYASHQPYRLSQQSVPIADKQLHRDTATLLATGATVSDAIVRLAIQTLRDLLAELYPEQATYRRVVEDAGLALPHIALSGSTMDAWHAICQEAQKQDAIPLLLQVAKNNYPRYPARHRAELLWLVSQTGVDEEQLVELCVAALPATAAEQTALSFAKVFHSLWQVTLQPDQLHVLCTFVERLADRTHRMAIAADLLQWYQVYRSIRTE